MNCEECLEDLSKLINLISPIALRAGLLVMVAQRMKLISHNYDFPLDIMQDIFASFKELVKPKSMDFDLEFLNETESKKDDELKGKNFILT